MSNKSKVCEKKMKIAEAKLTKIMAKIDQLKLNNTSIARLPVSGRKAGYLEEIIRKFFLRIKYYVLVIFVGFLVLCAWNIYEEYSVKSCLLEVPSSTKSLFRPPEDCSMCVDVTQVVRVANITTVQFEEEFAYAAKPVIVTDAADRWRATKEFNFNFFANFYKNGKLGTQTNDCFFFSYKSGLNSLQEVFSMDASRANLSGPPWYIGWSTCFDEETRALRSYYDRPYFLPKTAESDMIDWIFMGGPGEGAHMHVDSVKHKSWQAQIRGRKQWQLAPPPECLYSCQWITFTVEPGEILVVDTNRWYHKTNVLPGDISITIGAEYD